MTDLSAVEEIERAIDKLKKDSSTRKRRTKLDRWFRHQWYIHEWRNRHQEGPTITRE